MKDREKIIALLTEREGVEFMYLFEEANKFRAISRILLRLEFTEYLIETHMQEKIEGDKNFPINTKLTFQKTKNIWMEKRGDVLTRTIDLMRMMNLGGELLTKEEYETLLDIEAQYVWEKSKERYSICGENNE